MLKKMKKSENGFTLIELLVVISIIGVLSTVAMTSVNAARIKAKNTKKQADFVNLSQALSVFYATNNRMPQNYNPCCGACEGSTYYDRSMQELVDAGLLAGIPHSPDASKYCYYNYGANNAAGAILVTTMANMTATAVAPPGSCRPFGNNWCSNINASNYYCVCTPY